MKIGVEMKGGNMLRIILILSACAFAEYKARDFSDDMNKSLEGLKDIGPAITQAQDRQRQAKKDSIQRVSDSIDIEMKRMELEAKKKALEKQKREDIEQAKKDAGLEGYTDDEVAEYFEKKYGIKAPAPAK